MRRFLALLLLLSAPALAAVPTITITGNVVNPGGGAPAAGTISCVLSPVAGSATDTGTGLSTRVGLTPYTLTVSSAGAVSGTLIANDIITPAGTQYVCTTRLNTAPVKPWVETISLASSPTTIAWGAISRPGVTPLTISGITGSAGTVVTSNGSGAASSATGITYNSTTGQLSSTASHMSALAEARAYAASQGDPSAVLAPSVWDAWVDAFHGHPLVGDLNGDGTVGAVTQANGLRFTTLSRCSNSNCASDLGYLCIFSTDATANGVADYNNDGTPDFAVGDVLVIASSNVRAVGDRTHVITAIGNGNGTDCPSGNDNKLTVREAVDQNGGDGIDANADGTMDSGIGVAGMWLNDTHPSYAGFDFIGCRMAYATRTRDGFHGPNLLRNGGMDFDTVAVENWTPSTGSLATQSWTSTINNSAPAYQCFEGAGSNACFYFASAVSGAYVESNDAVSVSPGDVLILSWLGMHQGSDTACLSTDPANTGSWACDSSMTKTFSATEASQGYAYSLQWAYASFTVPDGVYRVRVRFTKGNTTNNYPMLDQVSLRRAATRAADTTGSATTSYLIGDPGAGKILIAGDSFATRGTTPNFLYGYYIEQGLGRCLTARLGRDVTSQVLAVGLSGHTTTQMLSDFATAVEVYEPRVVVWASGGANDIAASADADPPAELATFVANERQLATETQRIGAQPIFLSTVPYGPSAGAKLRTAHYYRDAQRRSLLGGYGGSATALPADVARASDPASQVAALDAYLAPYGNVQWLKRPAVYDIWSDIYHQRWLVNTAANNNNTVAAHCTGTGAGTCAASQSYTCLQGALIGGNSVDFNADGTADLNIGDVFYFGSSYADSGTPPTTKTYVASTIANGAGAALNECPAGEQKVGVLTYIDRASTDVNADGTIDSGLNQVSLLWMNNAHPHGGGSYLTAYRLLYAPRSLYGTNGPNLVQNAEINTPNTLNPMIPPEFTGDSTAATLTTQVAYNSSHPTGGFANCFDGVTGVGDCVKYTAATASGYIQTKTLWKLKPGVPYVASLWMYPENADDHYIALACDTKGDGTLADVTATKCNPLTAFITDRNEAHHYWCTMVAPRAYDQCALRIYKSTASAVTSRPLIDNVEFRELATYAGDAYGSVTQYLIPAAVGSRNIVFAGNSWAVDTGSGSHGFAFKTGFQAGYLARFGVALPSSQFIATGVNGAKASDLLTNWATQVSAYHPLICIFALGVNDAGVNAAGVTEDAYATSLRQIASKAAAEGCLPIFLSSPPAITAARAASTSYTNGLYVTNDTAPVKIYVQNSGSTCTSGAGGGPTGTGSGIADGTCSWNYVKAFDTIGNVAAFHTRERQTLLNWGF